MKENFPLHSVIRDLCAWSTLKPFGDGYLHPVPNTLLPCGNPQACHSEISLEASLSLCCRLWQGTKKALPHSRAEPIPPAITCACTPRRQLSLWSQGKVAQCDQE